MQYYLLINYLSDDYLEKRVAWRNEHLALAESFFLQGHILMAGALAEPANQSVLVFKVENPSIIESFIQADPYVREGLVLRHEIRVWNVVIGA